MDAARPSRDAVLAEIGRALRAAAPDRADALLQALEYATGHDPRPVSALTPPVRAVRDGDMLPALLAAANEVEARLPFLRRVFWRAHVDPVVDTTVFVLGLEVEPLGDARRAPQLAAAFLAAFAPEVEALQSRGAAHLPPWFFPRLAKLTGAAESDLGHAVFSQVMAVITSPTAAAASPPPVSSRFSVVPQIAPPLRTCFPDRAEELIDEVWGMLVTWPPRAKAVRHDGGTPGRTPRELALQVVELMNAIENEQPDGARATWSAAPAPDGAIEIRGAAA